MSGQGNELFLQDLIGLHAGSSQCEPGHSWGPGFRDHYKIHLVHSGRGEYQVGNNRYNLHKGQGFLIVPQVLVRYCADLAEPWNYSWIGFRGTAAAHWLSESGLSMDNPVFDFDEQGSLPPALNELVQERVSGAHELAIAGSLARFMAALLHERGPGRSRPSRRSTWTAAVLTYIEENAGIDLTVEGIARHVGLQRSYLGTLFRRETGLTIQSYLTRHRMRSACVLLEHSDLPVGVIARSVGYADALLFSKTFRRQFGRAPREFRAQVRTSLAVSPVLTPPSEVSLY